MSKKNKNSTTRYCESCPLRNHWLEVKPHKEAKKWFNVFRRFCETIKAEEECILRYKSATEF